MTDVTHVLERKIDAPTVRMPPLVCPVHGTVGIGMTLVDGTQPDIEGAYCSHCYVKWIADNVPKLDADVKPQATDDDSSDT